MMVTPLSTVTACRSRAWSCRRCCRATTSAVGWWQGGWWGQRGAGARPLALASPPARARRDGLYAPLMWEEAGNAHKGGDPARQGTGGRAAWGGACVRRVPRCFCRVWRVGAAKRKCAQGVHPAANNRKERARSERDPRFFYVGHNPPGPPHSRPPPLVTPVPSPPPPPHALRRRRRHPRRPRRRLRRLRAVRPGRPRRARAGAGVHGAVRHGHVFGGGERE